MPEFGQQVVNQERLISKQTAPHWVCHLWGQMKLSTLSHQYTLQGMSLTIVSL